MNNEFSWSKTRRDIFNECTRKYYFQYYGSWGGWEENAPNRIRQLYVLKQLKNRWMWAGEVVHSCLQRTLENLRKGIKPPPLPEILEQTTTFMREDFRNSRDKLYWENPKSCGLFEHEYKIPVSNEKWQELAEQIKAGITTFFNSNTYKTIYSLSPKQITEIEEFSHFDLEGFKIIVKLDFCYTKEGEVYIYDWKTGSATQGSELQMTCYALYAQTKWQVDFAKCKLIEYNLTEDKLKPFLVSPKTLEDVRHHILKNIQQMQEFLEDAQHNVANENDFPRTEQINTCRYCNFLNVCRPELVQER